MATPSQELRARLGERIPAEGTDKDTMFTDAEIIDLLGYPNPELEGWRRKAAEYANLVDTAEGTSKRAMSDLHAHALSEIQRLEQAAGGDRPTTKIHRIQRIYR